MVKEGCWLHVHACMHAWCGPIKSTSANVPPSCSCPCPQLHACNTAVDAVAAFTVIKKTGQEPKLLIVKQVGRAAL